jgi:hypothetical protein
VEKQVVVRLESSKLAPASWDSYRHVTTYVDGRSYHRELSGPSPFFEYIGPMPDFGDAARERAKQIVAELRKIRVGCDAEIHKWMSTGLDEGAELQVRADDDRLQLRDFRREDLREGVQGLQDRVELRYEVKAARLGRPRGRVGDVAVDNDGLSTVARKSKTKEKISCFTKIDSYILTFIVYKHEYFFLRLGSKKMC